MKKLLITLCIAFGIAGFIGYGFYQAQYHYYLVTPVDEQSSARISFTVDPGQTAKTIGRNLEEKGLIVSSWAFYKYVKEEEMGPELEAGKFILKKSYTIPEIAEFLTKARENEVSITIREGLTVKQVDEMLAEKGYLLSGSFSKCAEECEFEEYWFLDSKPDGASLEGYLFPDTYFLDPDTITPQKIMIRMLNNMNEKITSKLKSDIAMQGRSLHEIVTMASLIEKESRENDEKPIISGILWKRFEENRGLGVDATVRYALDKWTEPLTFADLDVDSPYNTRKYAGLPPGPISNFGKESLEAAINPQESEYYYYLHGTDGMIRYAKTNEEHNQNKLQYLR